MAHQEKGPAKPAGPFSFLAVAAWTIVAAFGAFPCCRLLRLWICCERGPLWPAFSMRQRLVGVDGSIQRRLVERGFDVYPPFGHAQSEAQRFDPPHDGEVDLLAHLHVLSPHRRVGEVMHKDAEALGRKRGEADEVNSLADA